MKHDVSFVTCVYDDIFETEFSGRHNRGTHYAFSLAQMHEMGAPIYCFTDKINMYKFFPSFLLHGYENFVFLSYNLDESPYHKDIQRIKMAKPDLYVGSTPWRQRCVEIMWGKFEWLMHVIEQTGIRDDKYTFWIDGGLSHEGILPMKYNTRYEGRDAYHTTAHEYHHRFYFDKIFNTDFPDYLVDYMEGKKLFHFMCSAPQHNDPHPFEIIPRRYPGTAVGGLFGGQNEALYYWAKECGEYCKLLTQEKFLVKEEEILSHLINKKINENQDLENDIKIYTFDTWYHEDWDVYNTDQISFSDFFEPFVNR